MEGRGGGELYDHWNSSVQGAANNFFNIKNDFCIQQILRYGAE